MRRFSNKRLLALNVQLSQTWQAGDAAYFPNGRAYWFREATGKVPAETINAARHALGGVWWCWG